MNWLRNMFACAGLALFGTVAITGCAEDMDEIDPDLEEGIEAAPPSNPLVWTGWVSEEDGRLSCPSGRWARGFECDGSYCDEVRMDCTTLPTGQTLGSSSWSTWFSEEGANERLCPDGEWLTGVECKDSYCDKMSIRCTEVRKSSGAPVQHGPCYTSGSYSEEDGPFLAIPGYVLVGIECLGSFCDDLRFTSCIPL